MNRFTALAALAAASIALSGCVSLFPKAEPAQMYRLSTASPQANADAGPGKTFEVIRGPIGFDRAAATDRILTFNGSEAAYIAGSRWVAPAPNLFEEALDRGFNGSPTAPRLVDSGRFSKATAALRLDVDRFDAVYENGIEAAPTVVVRVRAVLVRGRDRQLLGERTFEARQAASENRVGAIVPAFDAATAKVISDIAAWTAGYAGTAAG